MPIYYIEIENDALAKMIISNAEILKTMNGGVTFSGGEPLMQADFVCSVSDSLSGMHCAIQTSGYAEFETYRKVISRMDYIMQDIKLGDNDMHIRYTGIRPGELCALKWNDFGADFSCVKIDESLTDSKFETSTKTISSIRTIPLIAFLQNEYNELYHYKAPQLHEHVFINRCSRPYKTSNSDKKFRYLKNVSQRYIRMTIFLISHHIVCVTRLQHWASIRVFQ